MVLKINTTSKRQIINITQEVAKNLPKESSGLVNIFIRHTTAAITTADLDPGTDEDFLDFLQSLVPDINWRHPHNPSHAPDHLLSSLIGSNVCIPVERGSMQLGTWQQIILVELDGPRERDVHLTLIKTS
jgi:secondary thiamine-phosphate synthase enzyme